MSLSSPLGKLKADTSINIESPGDNGDVHSIELSNDRYIKISQIPPGWKTTTYCENNHSGYCLEGSLEILFDDNQMFVINAGEIFYVEAHHNAESINGARMVFINL